MMLYTSVLDCIQLRAMPRTEDELVAAYLASQMRKVPAEAKAEARMQMMRVVHKYLAKSTSKKEDH